MEISWSKASGYSVEFSIVNFTQIRSTVRTEEEASSWFGIKFDNLILNRKNYN